MSSWWSVFRPRMLWMKSSRILSGYTHTHSKHWVCLKSTGIARKCLAQCLRPADKRRWSSLRESEGACACACVYINTLRLGEIQVERKEDDKEMLVHRLNVLILQICSPLWETETQFLLSCDFMTVNEIALTWLITTDHIISLLLS